MTRIVNLHLVQMTGVPYAADANRRRSAEAARAAFDKGADVVVLPELIIPGYTLGEQMRHAKESLQGPTVASWAELTEEYGGYVVGGFTEAEGDKLYNTAVLIGPEGLVLHYRKLHLFGREKEVFAAGDKGLPVARTTFRTVGLCICYDLRFVEVARSIALQGAELLIVPTAWVTGFDRVKRDADGFCPQARGATLQANLNRMFMACASQAGDNGETGFLGSSLVADPYGHCVLGPFSSEKEESGTVAIDLDEVARAQQRSPLIRPREDRCRDVYSLWIGGDVL
jgi:predicted amidohydrolase